MEEGYSSSTATGWIFLAAGAAGVRLPFHAIFCLPLLFAAGMVLFDTLNGSFMTAHGWALDKPKRKVAYNLTVTALSVAVALTIGTVQSSVWRRRNSTSAAG